MIGLMFLVAIGLWIALAIYLGRSLPKWIGLNSKRIWTVLFTLLIIVLPVSDEIIGRYQFQKLCEKYEAVQSSTPNQSYEKLEVDTQTNIKLTNVIKPTSILVEQYIETNSRFIVRSDRSVSQKDGWILRWLGLAATSHCKNALIWRLSPQESAIRSDRGWAYVGTGRPSKHIESSIHEVDSILKEFDINK